MTVKELILELQAIPEDTEVFTLRASSMDFGLGYAPMPAPDLIAVESFPIKIFPPREIDIEYEGVNARAEWVVTATDDNPRARMAVIL